MTLSRLSSAYQTARLRKGSLTILILPGLSAATSPLVVRYDGAETTVAWLVQLTILVLEVDILVTLLAGSGCASCPTWEVRATDVDTRGHLGRLEHLTSLLLLGRG